MRLPVAQKNDCNRLFRITLFVHFILKCIAVDITPAQAFTLITGLHLFRL